jgi:hypothetical protein
MKMKISKIQFQKNKKELKNNNKQQNENKMIF